jgi:hypothetical protein
MHNEVIEVVEVKVVNHRRRALLEYMRMLRELSDAEDRVRDRNAAADCYLGLAHQYQIDLSNG